MSILELKDVCYSYSAEKPVLRDMNCTFAVSYTHLDGRAHACQYRRQGAEAAPQHRQPRIGPGTAPQGTGRRTLGGAALPAALFVPPLQADHTEHQAGQKRQRQGPQGDDGQSSPTGGRQILCLSLIHI